jgi:hypothetical protein
MSQLEDQSRDRAALDRSEDTFRLMSMLQVLQCVMAVTSCWPPISNALAGYLCGCCALHKLLHLCFTDCLSRAGPCCRCY